MNTETIDEYVMFDWAIVGQMSSETEPEPTVSDSEVMDNEEIPEQRTIENTSSLVDIDQSSTIRKSLLRDEMLINAQKFTSQVY